MHKQLLARASALDGPDKRALTHVVEKFFIACRIEREFADPRGVGYQQWMAVQSVIDDDIADQLESKEDDRIRSRTEARRKCEASPNTDDG